MQRTHLTLALAGGAIFAAVIAPTCSHPPSLE